jgi:short-subunit dehydrogenase
MKTKDIVGTCHIFMTGLTSGIGEVALKRALADGHSVTGIVRSEEQKKHLLAAYPKQLTLYVADLRDGNSVLDIAHQLQSIRFSHILLNAGYAELGKLHEISEESIFDMVEANLVSHVMLLKNLLPSCIANDTKICIVSSMSTRIPGSNYATYGMAKSALSYLVDALAFEYPKLRTLCVEIGGVATPFHTKAKSGFDLARFKPQEETGKRLYRALLEREGVTTLYLDWAILRFVLIHFHGLIMRLGRWKHGR